MTLTNWRSRYWITKDVIWYHVLVADGGLMFYGISNHVGYLMPNPVYIYIYIYIYIYSQWQNYSYIHQFWIFSSISQNLRRCPCSVMVKAMVCEIVTCEFELQSRYYVHFRTNTLEKGMNPLFSQLWVK